MALNFKISNDLQNPLTAQFEIVERKGRGHPDTLADRLAELLSRTYSRLSREKFGTIVRHQFDKLTLMGGKCDVRFGGGNFVSPIRLLINGRATPQVGDEKFQYQDKLIEAASGFLQTELRNFDFFVNCRLMLEITANATRGLQPSNSGAERSTPYSRFRPGRLTDLPEYTRPVANDTAVGCGWAPYTPLERLVLQLERTLNSDETKQTYRWLGSDIKIMAIRDRQMVFITLCVPQISNLVASLKQYRKNMDTIGSIIRTICEEYRDEFQVQISINTADGQRDDLLYLLYTGSCVESGDEGQVGRGNRIGGVISSRRPFSIEGLSGKNPQYHAGKLYSVMAWQAATEIWRQTRVPCEVFIVSQSDKPIDEPWSVVVNAPGSIDEYAVREIVRSIVSDVTGTTDRILLGKYDLS